MQETCEEIEHLKVTYMVPKVPSRMGIMLNRQILYEFKYLILMFILTALIEISKILISSKPILIKIK